MHTLRSLYHLTLSTCLEGIRHRALWAIVCLAMLLTLGNLAVSKINIRDQAMDLLHELSERESVSEESQDEGR